MQPYTRLLQWYKQRLQLARQNADREYARALELPQFVQAEQEIQRLSSEAARKKVYGLPRKEDERMLADAVSRRNKICEEHGLNAAAFTPKPECGLCGDSGFNKEGKACSCFLRRLHELNVRECGLSPSPLPSFSECDFELFDTMLREKRRKLFNAVWQYCHDYPSTKTDRFLFYGKSGTGKTFLAGCMADTLIVRGYNVIFAQAGELNSVFLRALSDRSPKRFLYADTLKNTDFLFVDDLGSEPVIPNVTHENLYALLSFRLERKKPTIITTNLNPEQLRALYGDRIFSRIAGGNGLLSVVFDGTDLRLKQKSRPRD